MAKDDTLKALGQLVTTDMPRDAVHIAVIPVEAGRQIMAGEPVHLLHGKAYPTLGAATPVGVADPYLSLDLDRLWIREGQRFWLFLLPGSITSLVHHWTHPAFEETSPAVEPSPVAADRAQSEAWLREFVAKSDCPSYERVIAEALDPRDNEYLYFRGSDAHGEIPPEFWDHLEVVSGRKLTCRPSYFSCSC